MLDDPSSIGVDVAGNVYVTDGPWSGMRLRRIDAITGVITTVANVRGPLAVSPDGEVFVADTVGHRILKVDPPKGQITTVAGTGTAGYSGDGGPATAAQLDTPGALTFDAAGDLYFGDSSYNASARVRRIDSRTGVITTIVGSGASACGGDGGSAVDATLAHVTGLAVDRSGNLYIADGSPGNSCNRIRRVAAATGNIATIAGVGGDHVDTGRRLSGAALSLDLSPEALSIDPSTGSLVFISDNVVYALEAPDKAPAAG